MCSNGFSWRKCGMLGLSISATTATTLPECLLPSQIQLLRSVVSEDEWKHRVLHQVIERPPSQLVKLSQILKVGDFSLPPTKVKHKLVSFHITGRSPPSLKSFLPSLKSFLPSLKLFLPLLKLFYHHSSYFYHHSSCFTITQAVLPSL